MLSVKFRGPTIDFIDGNQAQNPATLTYPWVSNQCGILHYLTTGQAKFDGSMYPLALAAGTNATTLICCDDTTFADAFSGGRGMVSISGRPGFAAVNQFGATLSGDMAIGVGDQIKISLTQALSWATPLFYVTAGPSGYSCEFRDALVQNFIIANDSRVGQWLDDLDEDINYKAMEYGLLTSQILMPLHPRIKEYARSYLQMMIMRDNIGVNNASVGAEEKYQIKYLLYKSETERTRKLLTRDIFWLQDMAIRGVNRSGGTIDLVRG